MAVDAVEKIPVFQPNEASTHPHVGSRYELRHAPP